MQDNASKPSKTPGLAWLAPIAFALLALVIPALVAYEIVDQYRTPAFDFTVDWATGVIQDVPMESSANYSGFWEGDVILAVNGVRFDQRTTFAIGVSFLEIQRGAEAFTLELPIYPLARYNWPYLTSAVLVALAYWISSLWLLIRRFQRSEICIIFVAGQAIAICLLAPMSNLNARLDYWPIHLSVAALYFAAPLILHHYLTFPVALGTARQRRGVLLPLYGLALISFACWYWGGFWGRQVGTIYTVLVIAAAIGVMGYVYLRRASPDDRRRLRLIAIGALLAGIPGVFFYLLPDILRLPQRAPLWLVGPFTIFAPASYIYAIRRHNLFNIDRLLNRTLVYAILSLGILLLYLGPYLLIYQLLAGDVLAQLLLVAALTLLVGLGFDWTRTRVQHWVDRIFYGGWYDYPSVVETISDALARCVERSQLDDVLNRQVSRLMQLQEGRLWIPAGDAPPAGFTTPMQYQFDLAFRGEAAARWVVNPRRDGEDFSPSDHRILLTIAAQSETALGNVLLVETLRRQLDELRASRETLAQAQRQLLRSREDERARLARELHDGPVQTLVGLNLQVGMLAPQAAKSHPALAEALGDIRREVQSLLADLRQVCTDLRPPVLDMLGLGAALRALAEDWSAQTGLPLRLDLPDDAVFRPLPGEVAVNLYRVAQEALSNVARHACARQATLAASWQDGRLALSIRDDGQGFTPPDDAQNLAARGHFGLVGMQERMDLIGGRLALESAPGQGTTVQVNWMENVLV